MKTETVIGIAVLGALGLGAYWLYTKNQARTNTTGVSIPIGGGGVTATIPTTALAGGLADLLGGVLHDLGGIFSGAGGSQSTTTSGGNPTYSTPISTDYSGGIDDISLEQEAYYSTFA